jgi:hypothetical protein
MRCFERVQRAWLAMERSSSAHFAPSSEMQARRHPARPLAKPSQAERKPPRHLNLNPNKTRTASASAPTHSPRVFDSPHCSYLHLRHSTYPLYSAFPVSILHYVLLRFYAVLYSPPALALVYTGLRIFLCMGFVLRGMCMCFCFDSVYGLG